VKRRGVVDLYSVLISNTSYVIRITTTTGFYYEAVFVTPSSLPGQGQTQVRIDSVTWDLSADDAVVVVRNTGSIWATIESISVRRNEAGSTPIFDIYTSANSVDPGQTTQFIYKTTLKLDANTSYVVRVTTTSGFYYEAAFATPPS
jgi:P pilus assembly chaperone PapD